MKEDSRVRSKEQSIYKTENNLQNGNSKSLTINNYFKNMVQKDTCTPMFIAVLFSIAKTWKQSKCQLTDEWIKKMWYIWNITQPLKRMK